MPRSPTLAQPATALNALRGRAPAGDISTAATEFAKLVGALTAIPPATAVLVVPMWPVREQMARLGRVSHGQRHA
jgi:hypothetical protein